MAPNITALQEQLELGVANHQRASRNKSRGCPVQGTLMSQVELQSHVLELHQLIDCIPVVPHEAVAEVSKIGNL